MDQRVPGTLQRHRRAPRGQHTARLPPSCNRSLAGSHDRRRQWSLPPAPCTRPPDRSHPSRPRGPARTSLRARATRDYPTTARATPSMKSRTMGRPTTGEAGSRQSSRRPRGAPRCLRKMAENRTFRRCSLSFKVATRTWRRRARPQPQSRFALYHEVVSRFVRIQG